MTPHPKLHGVKGGQKYDKLQIFAVFNYFPEDGYCYSSPIFIYFRNGLKNNFGLYTAEDMNNKRFVVSASSPYYEPI
ncbi:MAG: hypothetical protein V7K15_04155 [Nostoc sp.]